MADDLPIYTEGCPAAGAAAEATSVEGELVARVARGDLGAFESLYRMYLPRLMRFLQQLMRRPHAIEEVINDTMLVVWRRAATYTGTSKVSTWIFAIAYRKGLKLLARFDDPVERTEDDALADADA